MGKSGAWVSRWAGLVFESKGAGLVPGSMVVDLKPRFTGDCLVPESLVMGLGPVSMWVGLYPESVEADQTPGTRAVSLASASALPAWF